MIMRNRWKSLFELEPYFDDNRLQFPAFIRLLMDWRTDLVAMLKEKADIDDKLFAFLTWWVGSASKEHSPLFECLPFWMFSPLNEVYNVAWLDEGVVITRGMVSLWRSREDLQRTYDLVSTESRLGFMF